MSINIRAYVPQDAVAIAGLLQRSVTWLAPRDYRSEQVAVWLRRLPDAEALEALNQDGRKALVAASMDGSPVAYADLEPVGHIHFFYCAPEIAGQGVGTKLCNAIETMARDQGLKRVYVEASEGARHLFLRNGFQELYRREFELEGVHVHNYAMEKPLVG